MVMSNKEEEKQVKHIETLWERFRMCCVHPNAAQLQIDEMKSAFFAGVSVMFTVAFDNDGASDKQAFSEIVKSINIELEDYSKAQMDKGK